MRLLQILLIVFLLFLSGVFSGSETGYFSLSELERRRLLRSKSRFRHLAGSLLDAPRSLLLTILIGNMFVNIGLSTVNASVFGDNLGFAVILSTVLLVIFGEITPKQFALAHNEQISVATSGLLRLLSFFFSPLRFVLEKLSAIFLPSNTIRTVDEAAMKSAIEESYREGLVTPRLKQISDIVLGLDEVDLSALSIPMEQIEITTADDYSEEIFDNEAGKEDTKVVIITGETESIIDRVYLWSGFVYGSCKFEIVSNSTSALRGFELLKRKRADYLVLVDEHSRITGFVSGKRLLSLIFTPDDVDNDNQPAFSKIGESFLIPAKTRISELEELFGMDIEHNRIVTIGGFVVENLGRIPEKGEKFTIAGLSIKTIISSERKIELLAIKPTKEDIEDE